MKNIEINPEETLAELNQIPTPPSILVELFKRNTEIKSRKALILHESTRLNPRELAIFGANPEKQVTLALYKHVPGIILQIYDCSYTYPQALDARGWVTELIQNPDLLHNYFIKEKVAEMIEPTKDTLSGIIRAYFVESCHGITMGSPGERFFSDLATQAANLQTQKRPTIDCSVLHLPVSTQFSSPQN